MITLKSVDPDLRFAQGTRPRSCADLGRLAVELLHDVCIPKDGGTVRTLHKPCQTAARDLQQFG